MRTPLSISSEEIAPFVDEYIREVRRMRRAEIRASITERSPDEEPLTLTEDEIETSVDVIEALVKVAGYDLENNRPGPESVCGGDKSP